MSILISVEGGEYSGKDSQIKLLNNRLKLFNPDYKILSGIQEPGSTLKAEVLRMIVKNKHDTDFAFPGDFIKTFDLEKHKDYFKEEKIPSIAKEYIVCALMSMNEGVKSEVLNFLLNDSFRENSPLEKLIAELNKSTATSPADLLLGNYFSKDVLSPEPQLYLYMAARNTLYHNVLIPATQEYDFKLLNRSDISSVVYQGHAQNPNFFQKIEKIRMLNKEATEGLGPDLTILLDLPVEEIYKRKLSRKLERNDNGITKDFFDEKEESFHEKVRNGYIKEADYYFSLPKTDKEHRRIVVINAVGSMNEVHERVWNAVLNKVKN